MADNENNVNATETETLTETENQWALTIEQARALGSLVEKQLTTPDQYPLTMNSLMLACNQKSSRNPQMQLTLQKVHDAVVALEQDEWVVREFSVRTDRFSHRLMAKLKLDKAEMVALTVMILRGAQTFGEIRSHSGRMYEFEDLTEVELIVESLMEKELVVIAPKVPGNRETRYQQTLSPQAVIEGSLSLEAQDSGSDHDALEEKLEQLQQKIENMEAFLRDRFDEFD